MGHTVRLRGAFWPQDHWGRVTNAAIAREQVSQPALEAGDQVILFPSDELRDGVRVAVPR